MRLSAQQVFSDDQAITVTAASTNLIDFGAPGTVLNAPTAIERDIAKGTPVPILIQVTESFATLTSLSVAIQTDDDVAFGSATTVITTNAVPVASLVEGFKFPLVYLPLGITERYMRLNYTVVGASATAGAVTAAIVSAVQTND